MTEKITYADYLKKIQPWMLNAQGAFKGPNAGVNYALEGMTPEQAYAASQQERFMPYDDVGHGPGGARSDYAAINRNLLDPTWRTGPNNGGGFIGGLGNMAQGAWDAYRTNPALIAASLGAAGSAMGFFDGAGAAAGMGEGAAVAGPGSAGWGLDLGMEALPSGGEFIGGGASTAGFSAGADTGLVAPGSSAAYQSGLSSAAPGGGGLGLGASGTPNAGMSVADQYGAYGGNGGGITGGITGGGGGTFTGAAGGEMIGGAGTGASSLLDKAGNYLSDPSNLMKVGGTLLGAIGGAAGSKDSTTSNNSTRDPWGPAQPYLLDNLKTNAAAQEYYRQNPFSDLQKQQYQGLFNNLATNQANVPGLLANASNFGKSNRGVMPAMNGLLSNTQAPAIDWTQYQNIGRKG